MLRVVLFVLITIGVYGFGNVAWVTLHQKNQHPSANGTYSSTDYAITTMSLSNGGCLYHYGYNGGLAFSPTSCATVTGTSQ